MPSLETSILTLTKSKKPLYEILLLFQKIQDLFFRDTGWHLCFSGFISEGRGSFFCPALACTCKTSCTEIGQLMFKALWRTGLPFHVYYMTSLGIVLMALVMFWYMIWVIYFPYSRNNNDDIIKWGKICLASEAN